MMNKPRGRPRSFDAEKVLDQALELFWLHGMDGTSLDDIARVTGVARPSLSAAYGNKEELFVRAMQRFQSGMRERLAEASDKHASLPSRLRQIYETALNIYCADTGVSKGCFVVATAVASAAGHDKIRSTLAAILADIDAGFEALFRAAQGVGQLDASADPSARANLAAAYLHSLAVRARAGEPRETLQRSLPRTIDLLCRP